MNVGVASAKLVNGSWSVDGDPFYGEPAPNKWRRCGRLSAGGPKFGATGTISIRAHGLVCKFLPLNASDVRRNVDRRKLRIRPHFHAGRRGTNTIGFVVFAQTCHGKAISPRRGSPASRVFEATCSNEFGDAFQYRFRVTAPAPPHPHGGAGGGHGGGGSNCTPGYSPCIPPGPDDDCAGGGGNGPRYVQGPVTVTGSDPYGLDADNDGVGCE